MRSMCEKNHIPVFSIDTKKKEMVGPFRRGGQVYCDRSPRCKDHDFPSFASGKIIPYGIYDVQKNTGYMSFGISHDTAEFSCDNFKYYWNCVLQNIYPLPSCCSVMVEVPTAVPADFSSKSLSNFPKTSILT